MFLIYVLSCTCVVYAQGPLVDTVQGKVVGVHENDYLAFYGIPYGGPASGENRFKAPLPSMSYTGVYYATNKNIKCVQATPQGIIGDEDCLVLNIHTKNVTGQKPVLVWLESENYEITSTAPYSYQNLLSYDVVIVTINYRLSIFGFLCLKIPEAPGNAGLKDIVLGLKWIKQNIVNFGGDPDNIVLLGHGSGAALADILTLSPISTDLIHKAIILSGSALAPWAVSNNNINNTYAVGAKLNFTNNSIENLAKNLSTVEVNDILNVINDLKDFYNMPLFTPCIDAKDEILPDDPINLLKTGKYNHIPYLIGYTDEEGTIRSEQTINKTLIAKIQQNFTDFLPQDLNASSSEKKCLANQIRKLYFPREITRANFTQQFLNYTGDVLQMVPIIRTAKERASTSKADVYLFEFQYKGTKNSQWLYPNVSLYGVKHGDILNFLFDYNLMNVEVIDAKGDITSRFITFTYNGVPERKTSSDISWTPISSNDVNYLIIAGQAENFTLNLKKDPYSEKIQIWDNIYSKYHKSVKPNRAVEYRPVALVTFLLVFMALF